MDDCDGGDVVAKIDGTFIVVHPPVRVFKVDDTSSIVKPGEFSIGRSP